MRAVIQSIVGALAALAAAACDGGGGAVATCVGDAATYACSPVDAGGCAGNAPDGAPAFYPLGCQATFPGCRGSGTEALTCTCAANVGYAFVDAQAVFICGN